MHQVHQRLAANFTKNPRRTLDPFVVDRPDCTEAFHQEYQFHHPADPTRGRAWEAGWRRPLAEQSPASQGRKPYFRRRTGNLPRFRSPGRKSAYPVLWPGTCICRPRSALVRIPEVLRSPREASLSRPWGDPIQPECGQLSGGYHFGFYPFTFHPSAWYTPWEWDPLRGLVPHAGHTSGLFLRPGPAGTPTVGWPRTEHPRRGLGAATLYRPCSGAVFVGRDRPTVKTAGSPYGEPSEVGGQLSDKGRQSRSSQKGCTKPLATARWHTNVCTRCGRVGSSFVWTGQSGSLLVIPVTMDVPTRPEQVQA